MLMEHQRTTSGELLGAGRAATAAVLAVLLLWLGMLLGVSFLATPVKFLAPSLSLAVALDVGRQTFAAFNKIEWGFAALLLLTVWRARTPVIVVVAGLAALLVLLETLWLLPVLDERVGMIIAGQPPPPSSLHNLYIAAEVAKALLLAAAAITMWRRLVVQERAAGNSGTG